MKKYFLKTWIFEKLIWEAFTPTPEPHVLPVWAFLSSDRYLFAVVEMPEICGILGATKKIKSYQFIIKFPAV